MINLLKADLYMLVRLKSFYITVSIFLFFCITNVFSFNSNLNAVETAELILFDNFIYIIYFLLPFTLIVAAPPLTYGTIKNDISNGIPRTRLYISKLIIACAINVVMFIAFFALNISLAYINNGTVYNDIWWNYIITPIKGQNQKTAQAMRAKMKEIKPADERAFDAF